MAEGLGNRFLTAVPNDIPPENRYTICDSAPKLRGTSSKLHLYKKDDPKNVQIPTQECELLLFMIIDFGEVIYCSYIKDGVRLDELLTRMGLYLGL